MCTQFILLSMRFLGLQTSWQVHCNPRSDKEHCGSLLAVGLGAKLSNDCHAYQPEGKLQGRQHIFTLLLRMKEK